MVTWVSLAPAIAINFTVDVFVFAGASFFEPQVVVGAEGKGLGRSGHDDFSQTTSGVDRSLIWQGWELWRMGAIRFA